MSTSYYARIIPTKERREELKKLIDADDFRKINDEIFVTYGQTGRYEREGGIIHIGHRADGWKFLWNANQWKEPVLEKDEATGQYMTVGYTPFNYYYPTKESIKAFIMRPDVEIYDEYWEGKLDKQEFLKMALKWGYGKEEGLDSKSYYEYCVAKGIRTFKNNYEDEYWRELGYNPTGYGDFYNDGLRFSTSMDFR